MNAQSSSRRLRMRFLAAALLSAIVACTASWRTIVRYSNEPAPPTETPEEGVYRAVLRSLVPVDRPTVVIVSDSETIGPFLAWSSIGGSPVPGYWADTLKRELRAALEARTQGKPADPAAVIAAADRIGVTVLTGVPATAVDLRVKGARPPTPRVRLWQPGFNRDRTIATIDVQYWCGPLCGAGETLFLARRPGLAWRIFGGHVHWVS